MAIAKKDKKKVANVSIVTITQLKRFYCLEVLQDIIKAQTYSNIIEWIIIEGSKSKEDAEINKLNIQKLKESSDLKCTIIYLEWQENTKLGELRNKGNNLCSGDITVVMDDDDYYPPERVEHAVEKLTNSSCKIAGCSGMYIYDYILEKLYKFKEFGPNHSVNSCMAWKKEYLLTNKHDSEKEVGEEPSFTKNWAEKMVQLDADKSVILSSHTQNTFNKRELLTAATMKMNPNLSEVSLPITNFIKEPIYSKLKSIFYKESESKYDIVYFAGGFSTKWNPTDKSLGGSEQAIVHLSSNWAALGKKVAVYGDVPEMQYNDVDYFDWKKFPFQETHQIVILWRLYGLFSGGPFNIKAKHIWLDLHDGNIPKQFVEAWFRYGKCVTKVFLKSEFHKVQFEKATLTVLEKPRYTIIPNGIRLDEFRDNKEGVIRNKYRFCYCSCYTRGLQNILQYMWPIIYNIEPRAELHVYYGMNAVVDEQFKKQMQLLLSQPGVMDHGRQPMEMIIREKYLSNMHLYISESNSEIDCISIRESLATGAIPLISNSGVFKEREGIHFELNPANIPGSYTQFGVKVAELIKDQSLDMFRERLKSSRLLIPWIDISAKWISESF